MVTLSSDIGGSGAVFEVMATSTLYYSVGRSIGFAVIDINISLQGIAGF